MLIAGIIAGLILGFLAGGTLANLGSVRLRYVALLFAAVVVRFTTEAALGADLGFAETLRLPLFVLAYGLLLVGLWANRLQPGLSLAFVGVLGNAAAIVANGGYMPIWRPSLATAGLRPEDVQSAFHSFLDARLDANFLLHAGPFGDIIPIPLPFFRDVISVGDLFLSAGLAFFLFATVVRYPQELDEDEVELVHRRLLGVGGRARLPAETAGGRTRPETGLAAGFADAAALDRPSVLGGSLAGLSAPAGLRAEDDLGGAAQGIAMATGAATATMAADGLAIPLPRPAIVERARRHPYVRLALNPSFSALWTGGVISLFGDRVHQIALGFLVLTATNSPLAVALVFVAATVPNLLLSPIAGTFVDRWDHQEVMVVSDVLRAAAVLLVPIAAVTNLVLVYPLVFLITSISIFFRPARVAILPRLVADEELLTANSAMWLSETLADVIGYPLAGLFVGFLGAALPLAFWLDAATYIASAILLWTMAVPPVVRSVRAVAASGVVGQFTSELRAGWTFLRGEKVLLANTAQATIAQFTVGIVTALTLVYAKEVIADAPVRPEATYAFLETGIGVGNLLGGFVLGLIGSRLALGRTVIGGYAAWGLCVTGLALTNHLGIALGLTFGCGIANMVFVIPSQTLFQQRTPADVMGRVLGFRFALVFGSMTIAMGVGGLLGQAFGVAPVFAVFGLVTAVAGFAGLFVPAVRDA